MDDSDVAIVVDAVPDPRSPEARAAAAPPLPPYTLSIGQGDRLTPAFSRAVHGRLVFKRVVHHMEATRTSGRTAPRARGQGGAPASPFLVNDETFLSSFGNPVLLSNKQVKGGRALTGRRTYRDDSGGSNDDSNDDDARDAGRGTATRRRVRIAKTKHHIPTKDDIQAMTSANEALVPIRLELDIGNHRLRDSFLWNLNEPLMQPAQYAQLLCDDLDLPHQLFEGPITAAIEAQLNAHAVLDVLPPNPAGIDGPIVIEIDLLIGHVRLTDRFEWDPNNVSLTPEEFARILAADLGVGGEFVPEIAHAIHEQLAAYRRRLFSFLEGDESALEGLLARTGVGKNFRDLDEAEEWSPQLVVLNDTELERYLEGRERSHRFVSAQHWGARSDVKPAVLDDRCEQRAGPPVRVLACRKTRRAKRRARDDPLNPSLLTRGSRRARRGGAGDDGASEEL